MNRKQVEAWTRTVDYGYICELCGLSDFGYARMRKNGFYQNPCKACIDHFEPEYK